MPRRWHQVGGSISAGDGVKQAWSPGRARRKPLKPLRGECRVISGVTVVTMLVCFVLFRTRGFGCIERPAFPAPSEFSGAGLQVKLARKAAARSRSCVHGN